jgi:hypothetical protein
MTTNIDNNLQNLDEFIKEKELKEQIKEYDEYRQIYKDLEKLIVKNQLVIYGGFALNELLPKKSKIYDDNELPDYDVYIPYNIKDGLDIREFKRNQNKSINLIKLIEKFNSDNITSLQQGHNPETLKLFVNYTGVLDISFISPSKYKLHLYIYEQEKSKINKNQSKKFVINPIYLKMAFYQELGKEGSYFRWMKLYKRLHLFNNNYFNEQFLNPKKDKYLKDKINLDIIYNKDLIKVRNEVIKNCNNRSIIISGIYVYLKYILEYNEHNKIFKKEISKNINIKSLLNYNCNDYLDLIMDYSNNEEYNENMKDIQLQLFKKIKELNNEYELEVIEYGTKGFGFNTLKMYLIYKREKFYICQLMKVDNECILYRKKGNNKYIGEDGLIRFLYINLMNNYDNKELRIFYYQLIYNLERLVTKKYKGKIKERFNTQCLGDELTLKMRKKIGMVLNEKKHKRLITRNFTNFKEKNYKL